MLKTVNLFTCNAGPGLVRTKPIKTKPKVYYKKSFDPRKYQTRSIKKLKNESHIVFNAPTGSGKSYVITQLYNHELKQSIERKVIIAVPQTVIAKSFVQDPDSYFNENGMNNLCSENSEQNISELIRFIEEKAPPTNSDRVRICTHSTLVGMFEKIDKNKLKNITIWIDEGHHVKNSQIELGDNINVYESNRLGELVQYIVKNSKLNSSIKLSTATFFRGDARSIVSKLIEDKFVKFQVPYDEYLATLEHLESFSYDVVLYNGSYLDAIKKLKKQYGKHIVVYIPNVNSPHIVCDKYTDSKAIINTIGGGEWIDAVDESRRNFKKSRLMEESLDVRGITFLGMGKEGFDWKPADTSLILGERNSLTEVIQIIGRLLRDYPNKKHVKILHFLPFTFDKLNKEKFKDSVNNYLKVIYASMLFEDIFSPVKLRFLSSKKTGVGDKEPRRQNKLEILFEDPNDRIAFEEAVIKNFAGKAECATTIFMKEFNAVVAEELTKAGKTKWHKEIANQLRVRYSRKSLLMRGYKASEINIDLINSVENPFDWLLKYTSEAGLGTFSKLREVINNNYTIYDMQRLAEGRGGKCLSSKYISMQEKIKWECKNNHVWEAVPASIIYNNTWCPACSNRPCLNIIDMYKLAGKNAGKFLSKQYINSAARYKWKCGTGHIWLATADSIRQGHWCPSCAGVKRSSIDEFVKIAKNKGGKCISLTYKNENSLLKFLCDKGHTFATKAYNVKSGTWCPECAGKNLNIKDMHDIARNNGGKCLSNTYINAITKLKWQCSTGHIWRARPSSIRRGIWCPNCASIRKIGPKKFDPKQIINFYNKYGCKETINSLNISRTQLYRYLDKGL